MQVTQYLHSHPNPDAAGDFSKPKRFPPSRSFSQLWKVMNEIWPCSIFIFTDYSTAHLRNNVLYFWRGLQICPQRRAAERCFDGRFLFNMRRQLASDLVGLGGARLLPFPNVLFYCFSLIRTMLRIMDHLFVMAHLSTRSCQMSDFQDSAKLRLKKEKIQDRLPRQFR